MNVSGSIYVPLFGVLVALFACSSPGSTAGTSAPLQVDVVEAPRGVPDRGAFPAVVAIVAAGRPACSGALVAPDVVLTARHCVSRTAAGVECPAPPGASQVEGELAPSSLRVMLGEDMRAATPAALGRQAFVPASDDLCGADVALLLLDREIDVEPLGVRVTGIAQGDHVVSVGYAAPASGGAAQAKLEREHVDVLEATASEVVVGEASCSGTGGPLLDEQTGEIVGLVSRGGPACDGPGAYDVCTRADAFAKLIDGAMARGARPTKDGGTTRKPPTDMGAACKHGADCAAGVCVEDQGRQYCSRRCGTGDHCPTHFRCEKDGRGHQICVEH